MQDLRDVEGDRAIGRKTLPILYGDAGRYPVAAFAIVFGLLCPTLTLINSSAAGVTVSAALTIGHCWLAARVLLFRGQEEDKATFDHFVCLQCVLWASSALWLQAPTGAGAVLIGQ